MINAQCHGSVGFQALDLANDGGRKATPATIREAYRNGWLGVGQALAHAKPSDHGHALATGKVTISDLVSAGVDLHAAQVAYNRATGNGSVSQARKANGPTVASVEAALVRDAQEAVKRATKGSKAQRDAAQREASAMTAVVEARKAKRAADKAGKAGKVYSKEEIAALMASMR